MRMSFVTCACACNMLSRVHCASFQALAWYTWYVLESYLILCDARDPITFGTRCIHPSFLPPSPECYPSFHPCAMHHASCVHPFPSQLNYAFGYPCASPKCWPHHMWAGRAACTCAFHPSRSFALLPANFSQTAVAEGVESSVIHFVGEPKPWSVQDPSKGPQRKSTRRSGIEHSLGLWRSACEL